MSVYLIACIYHSYTNIIHISKPYPINNRSKYRLKARPKISPVGRCRCRNGSSGMNSYAAGATGLTGVDT